MAAAGTVPVYVLYPLADQLLIRKEGKNMPKVSVVVPVYNVEIYLRECMDSLVRQTLREIEIICVNDGSRDGSPAILREYAEKDPRIILIDQENGGYGRAMNAGIDRASGEYLGIVEPDDYISLSMFEDLYRAAEENSLDLVKADFYRFTTAENGDRTLRYTRLSQRAEDYGRVFRPVEEKESFFFVMNTWAGIYRLPFLREHGIRHHETPGASFQDNGFWFQTFLYAQRAMILPVPCYRVRRDNPNSSVKNPGKVYAMNREYDFIRGILERNPTVWDEMKQVYWRQRILNCGATLNRIAPELRNEYLDTASREIRAGLSAGEFSLKDFPAAEKKQAEEIMEKRFTPLPPEMDEAERLRNSVSYRVGRAVTRLPLKALNAVRSIGKAGEKWK